MSFASTSLAGVQARILRLVAQDCILLYRGFAIRKPFVNSVAPNFRSLPNAIRRYSRLGNLRYEEFCRAPVWRVSQPRAEHLNYWPTSRLV